MGFFDTIFNSAQTNAQSDLDRGRMAMQDYHNYATLKYPDNYTMKFQELQDLFPSNATFLMEGLGSAIANNGMSDGDVDSAMQFLADSNQGIPVPGIDGQQAWFNALIHISTNPPLYRALAATAVSTAQDVASGAQKVGQSVIATGSVLVWALPVIVVGGLALFAWNKSGGIRKA